MKLRSVAAEQCYARLKGDLKRGRFPPEAALNVRMLAEEFGVSISPVRDALGRLAGERLVLARSEGGFEIPPMTEDIARDLYTWHAMLIRSMLRGQGSIISTRPLIPDLSEIASQNGEAPNDMTAALFRHLVAGATCEEAKHALDAVADKLAGVRRCEAMLGDGLAELGRIRSSALDGDGLRLRAVIDQYHRRRIRHVDDIVSELFRTTRR